MPAVTRELSIIYGPGTTTGETVGGSSDFIIDGKIRISKSYDSGTVSCSVVVTGSTETLFAQACAALEAAWRKPRQRVRVVLGSNTLIDWDPAKGTLTNTGFDAVPSIEKAGDVVDTGRSRRYELMVTVTLPADLSGQNGLRESSIQVAYTPSRRRTVTISGQYTALANKNAVEQYQTSIGAYATAVLTAVQGGDPTSLWELADEQYDRGDTDKTCNFARVYEELIYPQANEVATAALPDDPAFVNLAIFIARQRVGPGDAELQPGEIADRLVTLIASFETAIDKSVTQDLDTKYEEVLKPWLVEKMKTLAGASVAALTEESPVFDYRDNRISGQITVMCVTGAGILEASLSVSVSETSGLIHVPVWSGSRFAYYEFKGHSQKMRVIMAHRRVNLVANTPPPPENIPNVFGYAKGERGPGRTGFGDMNVQHRLVKEDSPGLPMVERIYSSDGDGWRPVSAEREMRPVTIGIKPYTFEVMDETVTYVESYIRKPVLGGTRERE